MALNDGLYDLLLTEDLVRSLSTLERSQADIHAIGAGATDYLADVLIRQLGALLEDLSGDGAEKAQRQLDLVNELLRVLRNRLTQGRVSDAGESSAGVVDLIVPPLRVLRAVQ